LFLGIEPDVTEDAAVSSAFSPASQSQIDAKAQDILRIH